MAIQKIEKTSAYEQPFGRALGLLAACLVVAIGGWIGSRTEIILVRAIVLGSVVGMAVRLLVVTITMVLSEEDG